MIFSQFGLFGCDLSAVMPKNAGVLASTVPPVAPADLSYSNDAIVAVKGMPISPSNPSSTGDAPTSYASDLLPPVWPSIRFPG